MKKLTNKPSLLVITLFLFFTGFSSCQKGLSENDISGPNIYGQWNVISAFAKMQFLFYKDTASYQGVPEDHFTFSKEHIWYSHFQDDDEDSPFILSNSTITLTGRDEFPNELKILSLTTDKLTLYSKAPVENLPFPLCYQEMTIYLERAK